MNDFIINPYLTRAASYYRNKNKKSNNVFVNKKSNYFSFTASSILIYCSQKIFILKHPVKALNLEFISFLRLDLLYLFNPCEILTRLKAGQHKGAFCV